jgi:hypothetical protein
MIGWVLYQLDPGTRPIRLDNTTRDHPPVPQIRRDR